MLILILMLFLLLSFFSAYTMAFQGTTHAIGRLLTGATEGNGVQDSITPRSQTKRIFIMIFLIVFLFVITTYTYKWYYGILAVALVPIAGSVFGLVFGIRAGSQQMVMGVMRDMAKRYDSYRRQGDDLRARLMQELIERMKDISIDEIQKEARK